MQYRIGSGEPRLEHGSLGPPLGAGAIGIAAPAEIGVCEISLVLPNSLVDQGLQPSPVGAGFRPEDPVAGAPLGFFGRYPLVFERTPVGGYPGGERVGLRWLIESRDRARCRIDEVDQPGKRVAKEARYAQGDIDPRPIE